MTSSRERLSHLLELAAQGPRERAHLADEVADLLLDWPAAYPAAMRATFEALLEKIVGEMAPADCRAVAARFAGREDVALSLLNAFFFAAGPDMRDGILSRNDALEPCEPMAVDADSLLQAARQSRQFAPALAHLAQLPEAVADAMLADEQGHGLAVLARASGMARATFSALAILAGPARSVADNFAMLEVYDRVPQNGARHLLAVWRARADAPPRIEAAA